VCVCVKCFSNVSAFSLQQLNSLSKQAGSKVTIDETPVITDACSASLSLLLRFQRLFITKIFSVDKQKCSQIMSHPGLCLDILLHCDVDLSRDSYQYEICFPK
jgi:hypothetical protein